MTTHDYLIALAETLGLDDHLDAAEYFLLHWAAYPVEEIKAVEDYLETYAKVYNYKANKEEMN